ncbi:MAG: XrtA/PEP-CTERM system-associated ATPase [Vicinamibacterales bacterium]
MYEKYYNLRERPFALSPDPDYLYLSRVHSEALDSLRYGIESRAGFIVVTGEIGAGKTTLLQTLLQRLDNRTTVARVVNTTLDPRELLEAIALDFGLDTTGKSKPVLLRDLGHFLVNQRAQGKRPLLVIDEAQNLSAAALEEVRLLSNLETEKSKLLQILLAGQPGLRDTISSPQLEQFRQRVAVSYHLMPLDEPDTAAYINYRLAHAALGEPPSFPPETAAMVYHASGGVPRIVNVICDAALVFGYAEERPRIDPQLLQEVLVELKATGVLPSTPALAMAPGMQAPAIVETPQLSRQTGAETSAPRPEPVVIRASQLSEEVMARAAREATERASRLAAREQALANRERELVEQRRIMAEEYRLMHRVRGSATAAASPLASGRPGTAARLAPVQKPGFLAWVKRMLGGSRPVEARH